MATPSTITPNATATATQATTSSVIPALEYLNQESKQTLREALAEYYSRNSNLFDPEGLPDITAELFRQHDAAHVVFGCDTSLRGETRADMWTLFGTTLSIGGYYEYLKQPQVNGLFSDIGYLRIIGEFIRAVPDIGRIIGRCRALTEKWPWSEYDRYQDEPIAAIRRRLNIRVL